MFTLMMGHELTNQNQQFSSHPGYKCNECKMVIETRFLNKCCNKTIAFFSLKERQKMFQTLIPRSRFSGLISL